MKKYNIIQEVLLNKYNHFFLKLFSINYAKSINNIDKSENFKMIWNRRLGHFYNINLLNYLMDYSIKILEERLDYKVTKMKRVSHNKETPKDGKILETIHSDRIDPILKFI